MTAPDNVHQPRDEMIDPRRNPMADDPRVVAELMRLSEPGDRLLSAAIRYAGAEAVRSLVESRTGAAAQILHEAATEFGIVTGTDAIGRALGRWQSRLPEADGDRDLRIMGKLGARLLLPEAAGWPDGLTELGLDEPIGLWVRGPADPAAVLSGSVALVGSRAADAYGLHVAKTLAWDLVSHGRTVVSGGAYGIDAAAHAAAFAAAEHAAVGTVAFMAGGVDRYYPRSNAELMAQIAERYVVISEAAPGCTAMRHRFLMRNRLIAAVSAGTVVVQAGWRSGAINTANRAAELMRPVGAVPGPVTTPDSAGCHRLIREGAATCVTSSDDVLELVGSYAAGPASPGPEQGRLRITDDMSDDQLRVYGALPPRRGAEVAAIALRAGLDTAATMAALAGLELAGAASRQSHGWIKLAE
ncbi:DNA-processing protein DprA [Brevibacterium daeguense]|uniref:DNA-processing protein DprA n=1 Tax=Brevibacterium daeguense TaxID=909936 RepID=A0ABP8ELU2_9MICO|nr:DNA-processing protein DprA [Brevibacterium daeguense]